MPFKVLIIITIMSAAETLMPAAACGTALSFSALLFAYTGLAARQRSLLGQVPSKRA